MPIYNPSYPAPVDVSAVTAESLATTQELNRFLARTLQQRPRAPYSNEVYQRTAAELLGKGYTSAGVASDVSADVVDGLMAGLKVRGRTYTNLLGSKGYGDSLAGWSSTSRIALGTGSNAGWFEIDAFGGPPNGKIPAAVPSGHKIYIRMQQRCTTVGTGNLILLFNNAADESVSDTMTPGYSSTEAILRSKVLTTTGAATQLKIGRAVTPDAGNYAYIRGLMAVNLTALFGAGNEPDAATCDVLFSYIDGTRSTPPVRVKTTGKNLFNGRMESGKYSTIGVKEADAAQVRSACKIRVKPGTQIFFSVNGVAQSSVISQYNRSGEFLLQSTATNVTTRADTAYVAFSYTATGLEPLFQVEYGAAATAYEPYTESLAHAYWPWGTTGKQVGTVRDELDLLTGAAVKRISEVASISDTVYASLDNATYTNVDVVKTTAFSAAVAGTAAADGVTALYTSAGIPMVEVAAANIDEVASIGKYYYHTDKTVWFITAADAYADIAAARTGLGTTTLLYKLATPLTYQSRWNLAQAYQGGSLIVEPMLIGTRKPNSATSKLDITDSNLPASSIEQVLRHDVQGNGVLVETDVTANCTLDTGGAAITITGVDLTKVYTYRCLINSNYNPGCEVVTKVPLACARHDYGAAATTWTLTTDEANARVLYCTNAGGAADIVAPAAIGREYVLINGSGQDLTLKKSGGTGVALGTGKIAHIGYNGSDYAFIVDTNA